MPRARRMRLVWQRNVFRIHSLFRASLQTPLIDLKVTLASFSSVTSSASTMEPPTMPRATGETSMGTLAEACPAARGKSPCVASVIEAAEGAGMHAVRRAAVNGAAAAGMIK